MSATIEAPKTIPWGEIPPGSLCETEKGSPILRWPNLRNGDDACWVPTAVPAGGPKPLWPYRDSAFDVHVTLLAATLSDADCDALQCVQDPKVLVALATLLDRVNSGLAQTQLTLTRWKDIPPDSVAIIVRDETSKPGRAHGDIVWRHDALHAQFVGHITDVPRKWEITSGNWYRGQVVVLHEKASSIPGLAEMFARKDIAGIAAACATTCETQPEPIAVLPHKVGDVVAWDDVQPGTLVRLRDNREVLRWRECDAYGDDTAIVQPGNTCYGKVWKHGHKVRDITVDVVECGGVRDVTADISPCVVLGAGLSERMCAAVAEVDDQPQRWAIANGYYGQVSDMPTGSVWTYPGGWGVTFAGGQVAWVNYDGDDLIRMSRAEVLELEARLRKCKPTDSDLFVYGLAHCEMQDISDDALETIITHCDPHDELMSLASTRCRDDDTSWAHKWIPEKVADWATFHVRPDVRAGMKAKTLLCVLDILREPTRRTYMPTAWPTLRALGIHIRKPYADADLYGWWGQQNAPTRAASAVDLFLAYLAYAPGYAASAHAALGLLDHDRADIWLRAAAPSTLRTTISPSSTIPSNNKNYALSALAEQVSVQLYRHDPWHARITMPHLKIIDDARGIAVLTELFSTDVESKTAPVVDCGLQPVVLHHNHPCGVLVLWPYDPSPRGRLLFAAAAVAVIRQTRAAELGHVRLRIQFA